MWEDVPKHRTRSPRMEASAPRERASASTVGLLLAFFDAGDTTEHTRRVDEEKARPEAVDAGVAIARVVVSVIMTRRVVDIPARARVRKASNQEGSLVTHFPVHLTVTTLV